MRTVQQNAQEKHHCSALYDYCLVLSVSVQRNIATNIALTTAPLNMHAKNSELRSAQKIFISLEKKDAVHIVMLDWLKRVKDKGEARD
jgi:hypothetical protein